MTFTWNANAIVKKPIHLHQIFHNFSVVFNYQNQVLQHLYKKSQQSLYVRPTGPGPGEITTINSSKNSDNQINNSKTNSSHSRNTKCCLKKLSTLSNLSLSQSPLSLLSESYSLSLIIKYFTTVINCNKSLTIITKKCRRSWDWWLLILLIIIFLQVSYASGRMANENDRLSNQLRNTQHRRHGHHNQNLNQGNFFPDTSIFQHPDSQQEQEAKEPIDPEKQRKLLNQHLKRIQAPPNDNIEGFSCPNCLTDNMQQHDTIPSPKMSLEFSRTAQQSKSNMAADAADDDRKIQHKHEEEEKDARLEAIKHQILLKLGLKTKPNVTQTMPRQFILETVQRVTGHDFNYDNLMMMHTTSYHVHQPEPSTENGVQYTFADNRDFVRQQKHLFKLLQRQEQQSPSIYSNSSYPNQLNSDSSLYINDPSISYQPKPQQQSNHPHKNQLHLKNTATKNDTHHKTSESSDNKNSKSDNKKDTIDDDVDYDDFYGRTREIISFAERGK